MSTTQQKLSLTVDELHAFRLLRNAIRRKPQIIPALLEGMSRDVAVDVLLKAKTELNQLLEVNRAFVSASSALVNNQQTQGDRHV
jgi:hypothetical protein